MKKFVVISDTHNKHNQITKDLGSGDFIIHAGDITSMGYQGEVTDFLNWFSQLDFEHKIFIAGNHDFWFETNDDIAGVFKDRGVHYLYDTMVELDNIKIYGSPWQPRFFDWAFNVDRGPKIAEKWAKIPEGLDVLITHGPPFGILDDTVQGQRVGCQDLLFKVLEVKPRYHIFGHIHYAYGMSIKEDTTFINAASLGERYTYLHKPIQFFL